MLYYGSVSLDWFRFAFNRQGRAPKRLAMTVSGVNHDSVSQRPFSAQLLCRAAHVKSHEVPVTDLLTQVQSLIQESLWVMRSLVEALRPSHPRPLWASLRDRVVLVSKVLDQAGYVRS